MIYSLTGKLVEKSNTEVVIECGGVGYWVFIPAAAASALPSVGNVCTLYTYMNLSENLIQLFGFADKESQSVFRMLITVSGVGPKAGLAILSALSPDKIVLAISAGDYKAFTAANGIGPKIAQRLVMELKDKVGKGLTSGISLDDINTNAPNMGGSVQQAMAALVSLGYSGSEAAQAIGRLDANLPVSELIRLALQGIGKGR
ncbi:MAG: Holliday junction branch migration protein RuvA [Oscillospiraceae bacterium]